MAHKLFLDTNIIIDYVLERTNEMDAIKEMIHLAEYPKTKVFISESVITTCYYILQKHIIVALPVLREIGKVVNTLPISKDILYYPIEKFKDIEDGLLYFLAVINKMDYFITRKGEDFTFLFPSLPVISPTHFLKEICLNDIP